MFRKEIVAGGYINGDHAATTPPFKAVEKLAANFFEDYGSVHRGAGLKSQISTDRYEVARDYILKSVNAVMGSYLIYTGNTTGAMNCVASHFSRVAGKIAVSSLEHSSSFLPFQQAEGDVLTYPITLSGAVDFTALRKILQENTVKAVVLTAASNLTGAMPDIQLIADMTHEFGAYLILDACQFIQHHPVDMQCMGADFVAASGHKFYAPYGGGFLIGPKSFFDEQPPYQIGGGNLPYITSGGDYIRYLDQQTHDPGTPNAIGAVTMAEALRVIREDIGYGAIAAHEKACVSAFYGQFQGDENVRFFADHIPSVVIPFDIPGIHHREVGRILNKRYNIGIRTGSFCVYRAVREVLGITDDAEIAHLVRSGDSSAVPGICRVSLGLTNTPEESACIARAIIEISKIGE